MATRVTITKALEAEFRNCYNGVTPRFEEEAYRLVGRIVEILDDEQGKRAAGSKKLEAKNGLGYKELVALFRSFLGPDLLTPPKPNTPYIVKILNKAREQGVDSTNVAQICNGAKRMGPAPYRLGDLVWNADAYFLRGGEAGGDSKLPGERECLVINGRLDE